MRPSRVDPLDEWTAGNQPPGGETDTQLYRRRRPGAGNQCRSCGKTYRHSQNMLRHRRQCEGTFHLQCQVCGEKFARRDRYSHHLLHVHIRTDDSSCAGMTTAVWHDAHSAD